MEIREYQEKAMETCLPTSNNFAYMVLNFFGEAGEFSSKVAKMIRKYEVCIRHNNLDDNLMEGEAERTQALKLELGDIFWQLFGICSVLNFDAEQICQMNLDKLAARKKAGTIDGNGDGIDGEDRTR